MQYDIGVDMEDAITRKMIAESDRWIKGLKNNIKNLKNDWPDPLTAKSLIKYNLELIRKHKQQKAVLRKLVAMKPREITQDIGFGDVAYTLICCNCRCVVLRGNYCPHCGQRLRRGV